MLKQNWNVPANQRRPRQSGSGNDNQSLVCRCILAQRVGKPRKHGKGGSVGKGHNEKSK